MESSEIIFDQKASKTKIKVSIIIPIRDDFRVYRVIKALAEQEFKDFEVIFVNDSKKPFIDVKKISKNLTVKILYSKNPLSIAEKLVAGAKIAKGDYYAITETDCVPGKTWLAELYPYIKGKKDVLVKGNEARNQDMSLANLIFTPSCIQKCPFDKTFGYLSDVQWRRSLELNGFKIENINLGPMYHECNAKGNYVKKTKRQFSDIWEYSYLYLKYPSGELKKDLPWFLLNQMYSVFIAFISLLISVFSIPVHIIRLLFVKKYKRMPAKK